jgi:polysaccharide export outer membrane protein
MKLIGVCLATLFLAAPLGAAQSPPSPSQAQQLLERAKTDPALASMIRRRLEQSGLTPEQIRARLRASGYPEELLDSYLGPEGAEVGGRAPGSVEIAAIRALGLPPIELAHDMLPVDTGLIDARSLDTARVFGIDVFQRTTTQFLPLLSGPVPSDYRLGPGDVLALILTGDVEVAHTIQVSREGFALIPQVGQVHAANLTVDQLRDVLFTRLGRVYSGVRRGANATTRFDVTVTNVRANQVYVTGDVGQPGAYQISSLGSVLTALYAAGGITKLGNTRTIEVRRLDKLVGTFDLYDYLLRGNSRADIRLETGDVVFVPVHGVRAQVSGAVVRPAIYEVKPGETLADVLSAAGGLRADAATRRITVYRILPPAQREPTTPIRAAIDLSLATGPDGKLAFPKITLEDGDSVVVDSIQILGEQHFVTIVGMVNKAGVYPWRPGLTLRELVLLARGPHLGADLREAEIARLPADRSAGQLATTFRVPLDSTYLLERDSLGRYLGPPGPPFPGGGTPEVVLQPYDQVLLFMQPDFNYHRTVTVLGEVQFPGSYALQARTERLATLIQRAGGLTPRAYPEGIRFLRALGGESRINIDLPRALRDADARDNVILQPGDSIIIPEYLPTVRVLGAVNSPASVLWRRGANLDYYISAAGGFAGTAERRRVRVTFANGEIRTKRSGLFGSAPQPGPGSEVYVPTRDPNQRTTDPVALLGTIAQILASTVAIIVVATR